MLPTVPLAIVVDVVTELAREGMLRELQYAEDLILMSEIIERLMSKFRKGRGF